ncbi:hypothetical protein D3C73_499880 [compost metagenome]
MNWSYIFKHWGTTILIAPIILSIYGGFENQEVFNDMWLFPWILIGGMVLSLPTLLVYILIFYLLNHYKINLKWVKPILISLTVIGICSTCYLLSKTMSLGPLLSYSLIAIASGMLFRLKKG